MWVVLAVTIVVHGAVLGTVHALGMTVVGEGFVKAQKRAVEDPDLAMGCVSDAMLAASARTTLCLAPWRTDTDDCVTEAQTDMWIDLSSCQARNDKNIASVAMIETHQADKVKAIDPEPLLEAMKEQEQVKPPPVVPPPQVQEQPPPPPPPPPAAAKPMQIVETAKPTEEKAPDNARFLAEYDTTAKKDTVARGAKNEPMVAKSKPVELTPKEQPKDSSVKEQLPDRPPGTDKRAPDVPGTLAMRNPGAPSPAVMQQDQKFRGSTTGATGPMAFDGYMQHHGDGAVQQDRHDRSEVPRGQGGAGGGAPDVPDLKPSKDVLERALGGGNVDHLEQVEQADETALTAKRWVYASFFNRLKRQVAQNWDPAGVWRATDPTGKVYGSKTRVTEVRVSLSNTGAIANIVVISPSGVSDLDAEAIRAFHAAGPFPNPPTQLAGSDKLITFAFSFYFELGGGHTAWRVLRSM